MNQGPCEVRNTHYLRTLAVTSAFRVMCLERTFGSFMKYFVVCCNATLPVMTLDNLSCKKKCVNSTRETRMTSLTICTSKHALPHKYAFIVYGCHISSDNLALFYIGNWLNFWVCNILLLVLVQSAERREWINKNESK